MGVNPGPQVAVGAICVRDGLLLLVRRGRPPDQDRWSVPGGRVRLGEPLAAAVVRELAEETGLQGRVLGLCGVAERHLDGHHYVIVNHWVEASAGEAVAGDDAADARWVCRADLDSADVVPLLVDFLREHGVLDRLR